MSDVLDLLLGQAQDETERTVTLSGESVTVLLFASGFLDVLSNWLNKRDNPLDEISDADKDAIERLKDNLIEQLFTEVQPVSPYVIGQIEMFAFETLPEFWLPCEGQSLLRSEYPELLDAIGLLFGAVDNDHFNIPDMRRKFPLGAWPTFVDVADTGGEMDTVLETPNLPVHAHSGVVTLGTQSPARAVVSSGGVQNVIMNGTSGSIGSAEPHNNMPPYLVLRFGIFAGV